jgi:predicted ATPase
MGIATGVVEQRGDDYVGTVLNRTARVMAVGHGGQIVVAASTAGLVEGEVLVDLGEHRLRGLAGWHRLFQVRAPSLREDFPPLRTASVDPGNLPRTSTRLVGREREVAEIVELLRVHPLVTLTGVGGVGKTRLAVEVAATVSPGLPDGVWIVELAAVGDSSDVADAVATVLGVTARADQDLIDTVAGALVARHLLLVLDNCEHVIDAVSVVAAALLARAPHVGLLATSREALALPAEHLWTVPSLPATAVDAPAVTLFVERASSLVPGFDLVEPGWEDAAVEICTRLDGIPLALELAAARMVAMSPVELRDRLGERFRMLAGGHRGVARHQTLWHAVRWSYDLLDERDRVVLQRCSVFAGTFALPAATVLCASAGYDELDVLDALESLARKSLLVVDRRRDGTRYGLLETIRQFAEGELASAGDAEAVRDHHAKHLAEQAHARWEQWDGPHQQAAIAWAVAELADLRAAFRWALTRHDIATATTIAAHAAFLAFAAEVFEPVAWCEEVAAPARQGAVLHLPRVLAAAALCQFTGRPADAREYAREARILATDPRFDSFDIVFVGGNEAVAELFLGNVDRVIEIAEELVEGEGLTRALGLCHLAWFLATLGSTERATTIAEEALSTARARQNAWLTAHALDALGRALTSTDPTRALAVLHEGRAYAQDHSLTFLDTNLARDAAALEALHGELGRGLDLFEAALDSFVRSGDQANAATTFSHLAVFLQRFGRPDLAVILHGAALASSGAPVLGLDAALAGAAEALGQDTVDLGVAQGKAMTFADGLRFARDALREAREP